MTEHDNNIQPNSLDVPKARELCDRIQAISEELHMALHPTGGPADHPAQALLVGAANSILKTAMANGQRRYADYDPNQQ